MAAAVHPTGSPSSSAASAPTSGREALFRSDSGHNWGVEDGSTRPTTTPQPPPPLRDPARARRLRLRARTTTWLLFVFVTLVRFFSFVFLTVLAVAHLFLEELFGAVAARVFSLWQPTLVAVVFLALAAVNLALCVNLVRRQFPCALPRALCPLFGAARRRRVWVAPQERQAYHRWVQRKLRLRRRYMTLVTWIDDRVGLRGVWFSELMLAAEVLEISTQTYALFALADAGMGRTGLIVFATLLTGNLCVSALLHMSSSVRVHRDWLVVADTAFDFAFAVGFPIGMAAAFLLHVVSCDGFVSDWDFIVESLNLAGTFLVQEPIELFVKLVPFLSAHLLMSAVWDATEKEQLSLSKKWQVRRRALVAARSPRWLRALALVLSVGASATLLSVVGVRTQDRCADEMRFCTQERFSLSSTDCMCEVVDPECDAPLAEGDMADFVAEVDAHAGHVRAVIGDRCGFAEVPESFRELGELWFLAAAHGNITDAGVGPIADLRRAIGLRLDGNLLTQIPHVHASARVSLLYVAANRIQQLRTDVDDLRSLVSLELFGNPLAEVPCVYGELPIVSLQLQNTGLDELLPADCAAPGWRESLTWLAAGENNITALPDVFSAMDSLAYAHLGGSPVCASADDEPLPFDGVCEPPCAPACADWMSDDSFCEEQCDVEACAWDHGECTADSC